MPRPRFERADPKLREAVLDAAADELAEQGYRNASVNRILAAAGLSKGAFYYYFDDKADLAAAVLERETRSILDDIGELPSPGSVKAFWAEVSRLAHVSVRRGDLLARLGTAVARDSELKERLGPAFQEVRDMVSVLWRRGQEIGAVRTDLPLASLLAILEGMKLAEASVLLPADRAPSLEEIEAFTRVHVDLLRRVASQRSAP